MNRKLRAYIDEQPGFELNSPERENFFKNWTEQALARLDAWKQTGHNFLKANSEEEMEADYNILYGNILESAEKLDLELEEMRSSDAYKRTLEKLLEDYHTADKKFDSARTKTSLKSGVFHGAIYGTSSVLFQWLSGTGIFFEQQFRPGRTIVTHGGLQVDPGIASQLQSTLGPKEYQDFLNNISNNPTPETLWESLSNSIFNNPKVGNQAKNEIMTYILNATDVQNGVTKPELLIEAGKNGIFADIANNSANIDAIMRKLSKWGYK